MSSIDQAAEAAGRDYGFCIMGRMLLIEKFQTISA
jgi:hypothetical protein